ncbi:MAG: alpha-L-arabinofuranosidase, partial [Verrucomicrobia bacterium]
LKNRLAVSRGVFASAARDEKTGELILKVVNAAATPTETQFNLNGVKSVTGGQATVLTSENGKDENSITEPLKVSPKTETVAASGANFKRTLPGNSFTVLRLKTK